MKRINVRNLQKKIRSCVDRSQKDHIVVTRNGEPAAVIIGVKGMDWERLVLQTSGAFWKAIEKRRKEKTISLEELKKPLELLD
ncbi:MAG: hypothetical protein A3G87_03535 [Omnitrophica bacterium RIFCSPLOWO2_12_FULL_50_11]|nr:MAG: hypothetical protein A3G87_03535 [Omnitrophica bacterium RIFCSPLOWO2_12_FULL_50_11]